MTTPQQQRLYFAYGSNLSLAQMTSRCPTSKYHSLGLLKNYKWIIGERGYANVVYSPPTPTPTPAPTTKTTTTAHPTTSADASSSQHQPSSTNEFHVDDANVVYGLLYTLQPADEESLDSAEGVPWAYEKQELQVTLIEGSGGEKRKGRVVAALVYVDERRLGVGKCWDEYVGRMNRGIRDAVERGMESWYVDKYIRPFVPEKEVPTFLKDPFKDADLAR